MTDRTEDILKELRAFKATYETDMRGDKDTNNGKHGVIGDIRDLKEYNRQYPSLLWLLWNKPVHTIGSFLGMWILFDLLTVLNITRWVAGWFGVTLP